MSNPTGTEDGDVADAPEQPPVENDPVTEEIAVAGKPDLGERRYTAPGFDAGSTQIIDRVPDAPTEFLTTGAEALSAAGTGSPTAAPQVIAPARRRPRWRSPVALLVAGLLAAVALGAAVLRYVTVTRVSQEDLVRSTIQTFDSAVQQGDLATLRTVTCGQTRDNYASYDDETWATTYAKIAAAKQYPVVASIDDVVVNGDHAEANVTSYMAFDPETRSTRSFDLQFRDEQWKICQSS